MMQRLATRIQKQLAGKRFAGDDELYLYLLLLTACAFAVLVYLALMLFHVALGIWQLAVVSGVLLLSCLVCVPLVRRRRAYGAAGNVIVLGVVVNTTLSIGVTGINSYAIVYYLVAFVMVLTIPYTKGRVRGVMVAVIWLFVLLGMAWGFSTPPLIMLARPKLILLAVINVNVCMLGLFVELTAGTLIREGIRLFDKAQLDAARSEADTDALTGLYNRHYAGRLFARLAAGGEDSWCVALLDIDDFKSINDNFGHVAGDEVIRSVACSLQKGLRKHDHVFRWGGEEFLVLLHDVDKPQAHRVMDTLRARIAATAVDIGSEPLHASVTIGVSTLDLQNTDTSIAHCDARMYEGKNSGKNIVVS